MALPIHSPHNERLKRAIDLRGHKGRVRQGRFLIDGLREATRALQSSLEIDEVFICPEVLQSGMAQRLVDLAAARCQRVYEIPEHLWKKLRYGDRPDGIILVGCDGPRHLSDARLNAVSLVVVIQGVEKPGNIGAIVRSADAAGASAVILADGTHDIYNPNTIRASMGTIFQLPVLIADSPTVRDWLRSQSLRMVSAVVDVGATPWESDLRPPLALILGSEAEGLSPEWRESDVTLVRIPMRGQGDSLNVSVTAAILMYECQRQQQVQLGTKP